MSRPEPHGAGRLTTYYVCALSAVALLSIAGQILVQTQLGRQRLDSKVVNLAGRQRMLGQRVGKCAVMLAADGSVGDAARYLEELRSTLPLWHRNHAAMQQGDAELGLPGDNSPTVTERFNALNSTFDEVYAAAERVIQAASQDSPNGVARREAIRADVAEILRHESDFLLGMDAIVSQYETEAERRVARLQAMERVLLVLTLVVLLLEGLFVFRPAVARIKSSFAALQRAGDELRIAKEAAETASAAKSAFLANMSHELRTPLHAVLGAAELLRRPDSDLHRREYLDVVEESGRMLLCLLNDLLDLSKVEAGKMELRPTTFDLRAFAENTVAMFSSAARAKGLDLRLTIAEQAARLVTADSLRLRQVLANLLNNAIKFTDSGRIEVRITTTEPANDRRVTLRMEIVDTGIGIPAAEQRRIFEAFTQIRSSDDALRGGVGLGLDIASRLVTLMNGRLRVHSEPGRGSTFVVEIDCPSDESLAVAEAASREGTAPAQALEILAAEDAPMIRRILEETLRAAGHSPYCTADGREAIELFERRRFDVVLLDLRMPEVDGIAAAAAIRESERRQSRPRTPIIALTAAAPSEVADKSLSPDFDAHLLKPFTGPMLEQVVRRLTGEPLNAERFGRVLARLQGRRPLLAELVELFLADAPALLAEIEQAYALDDRRRLKTAVHRLRGQLEMFEVRDAAAIADRLERHCDAGERPQMKGELSNLLTAWPSVRSDVSNLV
jgi:signal transduction histidine kinase/DNA-binding NarL/FixJ family response regulator